MAVIHYFDNIYISEDVDETNGAVVASDLISGAAEDESSLNDQTHATTCDDWNFIESKVVSQTGEEKIKPGENFVLYARIWNDESGLFLTRADIDSITATFYLRKMRTFAATEWRALDGFANLTVPNTTVVACDGDWRYDQEEWNFAWSPPQTNAILCQDEGGYACALRVNLTNGRAPLLGAIEFLAMN